MRVQRRRICDWKSVSDHAAGTTLDRSIHYGTKLLLTEWVYANRWFHRQLPRRLPIVKGPPVPPYRPCRSLKARPLIRIAGQITGMLLRTSFATARLPWCARTSLQYMTVFRCTRFISFRCGNPECNGCVVPQIPVGELSDEMNALNQEIAERVSFLFAVTVVVDV